MNLIMKKQFVTYEIALKLKELGFDEECLGYYTINNKGLLYPYNKSKYINRKDFLCVAPLWQQVIDWLNVEYGSEFGINLTLQFYQPNDRVYYNYVKTTIDWDVQFPTYQKACEQAILKCIELCQNKK